MNLNEEYIKAKELIAKKFSSIKNPALLGDTQGRLPPGQKLTTAFPVLDLGYQPMFFEKKYRLEMTGLIENPISLTWKDIIALPRTVVTTDFHCVTKWSKYDVVWGGVLLSDIIRLVKPKQEVTHVLQFGLDGYTTNTTLESVMQKDVLIAYELNGEPLPREHGGPIRMIIPHLYAWKGSKFLTKLEFLDHDEPGFWEVRGYSNTADPWKEERYSS